VATDVLTRRAVLRVDRNADSVFRELHDPRALMSCVPGGRITRILDARRFEATVAVGVGPFRIAYAGMGQIKDSDSGARTASLTIAGGGIGMPPSRVRMAMVVTALDSGAVLDMSFRMTIANTLLSRELVDFIVADLLCRTVQRMKAQLERRAFHPRTDVGWIGGFHRRLQPCSIEND
jgi:carbon monoxide dehydrogenase subunit G